MSNIIEQELDLKLKKGCAVCFDFDRVIHKYSKGWKDGSIYDEYNKDVLDLMLFLQKNRNTNFYMFNKRTNTNNKLVE